MQWLVVRTYRQSMYAHQANLSTSPLHCTLACSRVAFHILSALLQNIDSLPRQCGISPSVITQGVPNSPKANLFLVE